MNVGGVDVRWSSEHKHQRGPAADESDMLAR